MNKVAIVASIIERLKESAGISLSAAKRAHAEATDEENIAEDKYDTRGLEASYLALGQANQMQEMVAAIQAFSSMFIPKLGPKSPIDLGALIELSTNGEKQFYFIGPGAGGTEIKHAGKSIIVLTLQSPLGEKLAGKQQGDEFKATIGKLPNRYKVLRVL